MAVVYRARDLKHDRLVAIKVFKPELAHALGPDRFLREIKVTAQLSHPHILPLLDSGEANGLLFYVTPYVEGESLRHRLEREHRLPLDEALRITREVADGLESAHRRRVRRRPPPPLFQHERPWRREASRAPTEGCHPRGACGAARAVDRAAPRARSRETRAWARATGARSAARRFRALRRSLCGMDS